MLITDQRKGAEDITYFHTLLIVITDIRIFIAAIKTVWTVLKDFFFMQSPLRPKKLRPPFVWIDHEIDKNIPFAPEWVEEYLHFIPLWVCSITWLRIHFGTGASSAVVDSLNEVSALYKEAARVYKVCQSTTVRPAPQKGNLRFYLIHATDPHLNCLPSLHIMLVTWAGFNLCNRILKLSEEDVSEDIAYIKHHAFLITESILYVKQHSVNCIPAALFSMKELYPGFEEVYGKSFIRSLFSESEPKVISQEDITEYMVKLYDYFIEKKNEASKSASEILIDFLLGYSGIETSTLDN